MTNGLSTSGFDSWEPGTSHWGAVRRRRVARVRDKCRGLACPQSLLLAFSPRRFSLMFVVFAGCE